MIVRIKCGEDGEQADDFLEMAVDGKYIQNINLYQFFERERDEQEESYKNVAHYGVLITFSADFKDREVMGIDFGTDLDKARHYFNDLCLQWNRRSG